MIKRAGMKRSLRTSRTPSRKVLENLEASVQLQEERKGEKQQTDAHTCRKARKRKLESLDAEEERLHKQACLQSTLHDQLSHAQPSIQCRASRPQRTGYMLFERLSLPLMCPPSPIQSATLYMYVSVVMMF